MDSVSFLSILERCRDDRSSVGRCCWIGSSTWCWWSWTSGRASSKRTSWPSGRRRSATASTRSSSRWSYLVPEKKKVLGNGSRSETVALMTAASSSVHWLIDLSVVHLAGMAASNLGPVAGRLDTSVRHRKNHSTIWLLRPSFYIPSFLYGHYRWWPWKMNYLRKSLDRWATWIWTRFKPHLRIDMQLVHIDDYWR